MHGDKALDVFAAYLPNSTEHQAFIKATFDAFGTDWFWLAAASSSGKYHPAISGGVGGLVRHTKLATWWGKELIQQHDVTINGQNDIATALICHDLQKTGDPYLDVDRGIERDSSGNLLRCAKDVNLNAVHGVDLCNAIRRELPILFDDRIHQDRITTAIACHMGHWSEGAAYYPDNQEAPHRFIAQIVHNADFCASRKVDNALDSIWR